MLEPSFEPCGLPAVGAAHSFRHTGVSDHKILSIKDLDAAYRPNGRPEGTNVGTAYTRKRVARMLCSEAENVTGS